MRLVAVALVGGVLSYALAYALVATVSLLFPCVDSQSACRLGDLIGYGLIALYAPLATVTFAIVSWRAPNERALSHAALALLAPIAAMLLYGVLTIGFPTDPMRDGPDLLSGVTAPTLIVVVQWAILRASVMRAIPA